MDLLRGRGREGPRLAGGAAGTNDRLRLLGKIAGGLALLCLLLPVLAYHVAPLAGLSLPALQQSSALLRSAEEEFEQAGFELTPAVSRNARMASLGAPLASTPFYFQALALDEEEEPDRIIALLDEALRRDPRHTFARLWRARMYYRTKRIPEAVYDVIRVIPLDHERSTEHIDALVDLARDPASHSLLLELIRTRPPWATAFARRASETLPDEEFLLAVASQSDSTLDDYVQSLANKGEFERAFLIWQSSLTADQLLSFSWPYDSRFDPKEAASTFGWRTNNAMTTRDKNGLHVFFAGRGQRTAASQSIMLGPGYAYTLTVSLSGEMERRGGSFRWSLLCVETNQVIAKLDLMDVAQTPSPHSIDFAVPEEGCSIQSLVMTAIPGEQVIAARATIHEVTIHERAAETSTDSGADELHPISRATGPEAER
jgi:tetratricopeptide (TPR) repeat protein